MCAVMQEGPTELSAQFYMKCCRHRGAKPNLPILSQINHPKLMLLRVLDASHTFLGSTGVLAVLDFIAQHQCIEQLLLPQNGVNAACVERLCDLLRVHPSLRSIDLSNNFLTVSSVRLIWETAGAVSSLEEVRLCGCGVPQAWEERLQRQLARNIDRRVKIREEQGLLLGNIPCSSPPWRTVCVLLLGAKDYAVERYCHCVLQPLAEPAASMHLQIAPVVVTERDTVEQVQMKIEYCRVARPCHSVWCVVMLDAAASLLPPQRLALGMVLSAHAFPVAPHDRPSAPATWESLFVYYTEEEEEVEGDTLVGAAVTTLPPSAWLRRVGYDESECVQYLSQTRQEACRLTPASYEIRCQSELLVWLRCVYVGADYAEAPTQHDTAGDPCPRAPLASSNGWRPLGGLANPAPLVSPRTERLAARVLQYVRERPGVGSAPLVVYGPAAVGKGSLLRHVSEALCSHPGGSRRSAYFDAKSGDAGLVVILYRLLELLHPGASEGEYLCLNALQRAVNGALTHYCCAEALAVFVSHVDQMEAPEGDVLSPVSMDWLPPVLGPGVRVVVSLNVETALLSWLRSRFPQPQELVLLPPGEMERTVTYCDLLRQQGLSLPGLAWGSREGCLTAPETAYAQKPGAVQELYAHLAAAYTEHLLRAHRVICAGDTLRLIQEHLPGDMGDLIEALCHAVGGVHGADTVQWVTLCVAACPLSVSDVQVVCERIGDCTAHTAVPALLQLARSGLVAFDSCARAWVPSEVVRHHLTRRLYPSGLSRVSVAVEVHLRSQVHSSFSDTLWLLSRLVPIMISNGSINAAAELLLDAALMDRLWDGRPSSRFHITELFLRLLSACDLLDTLAAAEKLPGILAPNREELQRALKELQSNGDANLWQRCLLNSGDSPLRRSAHQGSSSSNGAVSYPFFVSLNNGVVDQSWMTLSRATGGGGGHRVHHLHCNRSHLVASTLTDVTVYDLGMLAEVACLAAPFGDTVTDAIAGSLLGIGTRVVVMGATHILVWDFVAGSRRLFADAAALAAPSSLDAFGASLITTQPAEGSGVSIISLSEKRVMRTLPLPQAESQRMRRAQFCGVDPLIIEGAVMRLYDDAGSEAAVLVHDGPIGVVDCTTDGRLIASTVGAVLWLWRSTGGLLNRLDTFRSCITRVTFSGNGLALVAMQAEGASIWRATTGTMSSVLPNPFEDESSSVSPGLCFSEDSTRLLGRVGCRIVTWDVETGTPLGAYTAPTGYFTTLCEHRGVVYAALDACGDIKAFSVSASPLPTIQDAKNGGGVTTNWLQSGCRISTRGIHSVSIGSYEKSWLVVCVVLGEGLHIFSLLSGERLPFPPEHLHLSRTVCAAGVVLPQCVAYVSRANPSVYFATFEGEGSAAASAATVTACFFPAEIPWVEEAEIEVYPAAETSPSFYMGLVYSYGTKSKFIVYQVDPPLLLFQLDGHQGRVVFAALRRPFAYTIGSDQWIHLWNLERGLMRASYHHPHSITAATAMDTRTGKGGYSLLCIDHTGAVHLVAVRCITSATKATFTLTHVKQLSLPRGLRALTPCSAVLARESMVLLFGNSDDNALHVGNTTTSCDDRVRDVGLHACSCIAAGEREGESVLVTGHTNGRLLLHRVVRPVTAAKVNMQVRQCGAVKRQRSAVRCSEARVAFRVCRASSLKTPCRNITEVQSLSELREPTTGAAYSPRAPSVDTTSKEDSSDDSVFLMDTTIGDCPCYERQHFDAASGSLDREAAEWQRELVEFFTRLEKRPLHVVTADPRKL